MKEIVNLELDLLGSCLQEIKVSIKWKPVDLYQEFNFPKWTPGSYKIRDHVQYLYSLVLEQDGQVVPVKRVETSKWSAQLDNLNLLKLTYIIEARNLTVRTSYIDDQLALLCMSNIVMLINEHRYSNYHIELNMKDEWKAYFPLEKINSYYFASDYDALVDSTLAAGIFESKKITVRNYIHELLLIGKPPKGWPNCLIDDVIRICNAACSIFNEDPPSGDRYIFMIQILDNAYGGLEHDNSTFIQYDWRRLEEKGGYRKLLQLIGHEYFHQWNVRRLRPIEYVIYDYNKAIISESLWFAEGITSYFDLALPMLASISSHDEFLDDLAIDISEVLSTPGRKYQSLSESSKEAWVKLYLSTLQSKDSQINYYRFGTILAFCLDIRLREQDSSLSLLMRNLWDKFGRNRAGYNRIDIKNEIDMLSFGISKDLDEWIDGTDSLPIDSILEKVGCSLIQSSKNVLNTGLHLKESNGYLKVMRVSSNSPASLSSLVVNDQIIAINNHQVSKLDDVYTLTKTDCYSTFTFFRNGVLMTTSLEANLDRELKWSIQDSLNPSAAALELRNRWLAII